LFIVGCGSYGPQNYGRIDKKFDVTTTKIQIEFTYDVSEVCAPEDDACASFSLVTPNDTTEPYSICTIYIPPYNKTDGLWWDSIYLTWLLGHEVTHCLWGDWHP
jgi:hypothetical protein